VQYLTTKNSYRSVNTHISWLARNAPTLIFYAKMVYIVWKSNRLAQKGIYNGEAWVHSSVEIIKALESVGTHFEIQNLDFYRDLEEPCVFVGNHMSILETFVLPCLIQPYRNITFVVKESLISYPFFGPVLRSRDPVVVGRVNPRDDLKIVLEEGQNRLNHNVSVVIFPQTTRSPIFDTNKFNTLGVKLAKRANVPVVPFALKTDAWGLGRRLKDFGKISPEKTVRIHFGNPMHISGSGKEEHHTIIEFISAKLNDWRRK
jgi:1-acyl-sn-glycerol-3-phosphate acyltransferase